MSDTVNVDTLVERLRTHITTDGLVVPSDEALATLDDLAARARKSYPESWNEEIREVEDDRDRLARRVTELDASLRAVSEQLRREGYLALAERIDTLAGDGGGA